jgi:hypothetical protein
MKNRFDAFVFAVILAALFCVGSHIGKEAEASHSILCTVTLSLTEERGDVAVGDKLYIDSAIESTVLRLNGRMLTLTLYGTVTNAGFLAGGAKYISLNQPIKLSNSSVYAKGRVSLIVY